MQLKRNNNLHPAPVRFGVRSQDIGYYFEKSGMVKELIRKYLWLVDQFSRASSRGLTLEQVMRRWEQRWGEPYNRRSFFNHRSAILEIFDIEIKCDRSTNLYYIDREELEDSDTRSSWLINTFTVNSLLSMSKEGLAGRVSVENIPSGQKWLVTLMDAMLQGEELLLDYQKYTDNPMEQLTVQPYALKEVEKRWYLVAFSKARKALRMYSLDRIKGLAGTGRHFRMPEDFDVDFLFRNSFGAYITERKDVRHIVLKATEREAKYLRDLPLHHSQEEPSPGIFTLDVAIGEDLVLELLRHGNRLEVLEPQELRQRIAEEFTAASAMYGNNNK